MAVPARLSRTLHLRLGEGPGEDLVDWMGQMEANRSELRDMMGLFQSRTDARFEVVDRRFEAVDRRFDAVDRRFDAVDARFDAFEARMDSRFVETNARMDAGFASLEIRFERRFADLIKWSFVFWVGSIAALAALAQLVK